MSCTLGPHGRARAALVELHGSNLRAAEVGLRAREHECAGSGLESGWGTTTACFGYVEQCSAARGFARAVDERATSEQYFGRELAGIGSRQHARQPVATVQHRVKLDDQALRRIE